MSKCCKRLQVIIMLVAGLVVCLHLIIPHDHHFTSTCSQQEQRSPLSKSTSDHSQSIPTHCNVLNDITLEKAAVWVIANIDYPLPDFCPFGTFNANLPGFAPVQIGFNSLQILIVDPDFLDLSLLRGPPARA